VSRPTHWRLDGPAGWRTASADGVVAGAGGIRLGPVERGFADPDGSLGGLRLPAAIAVGAGGEVYVLDPSGRLVRGLTDAGTFEVVLGSDPGRSTVDQSTVDGRTLAAVAGIAVAGQRLYCVDTALRRVSVFGLPALELRQVWAHDPGGDPAGWEPVAVAAGRHAAYVLDRRHGRVWRFHPLADAPDLVVDQPAAAGRWSALAVDRDGFVYAHDPLLGQLDIFTATGAPAGRARHAAEVADRFDEPAVRTGRGTFRLPAAALRRCGPPAGAAAWTFDLTGARVGPERPAPRYATDGEWTSLPLDSGIFHCEWDRVVVDLAAFPPGTSLTVSTATLPDAPASGDAPEPAWVELRTITAPVQGPADPVLAPVDWPVRGEPGQRIAVRLRLHGTGQGTPVVSALRVFYPRQSTVDFLPALFGADPDARDFLERFLGGLQSGWDDLEERIAGLPAYADPAAVPAGDALRFLGSWFGVPFDQRWAPAGQRAWLRASLTALRRRGTPAAVRDLLAAGLANLTGLPAAATGYPILVEAFRERNRLRLVPGEGPVDPLWSPRVVGRLRSGEFAQLGQARLVSTGRPTHDIFETYAHRFRVYLPACWIRDAEDLRTVRRLLTAEKPASTLAELCLVEPRLRVGVQSTVGLDAVVGAVPRGRLACGSPPPPGARLGFDLVLGGTRPGPLRIAPGVRVGTAIR
jgi:phage tail-like protein